MHSCLSLTCISFVVTCCYNMLIALQDIPVNGSDHTDQSELPETIEILHHTPGKTTLTPGKVYMLVNELQVVTRQHDPFLITDGTGCCQQLHQRGQQHCQDEDVQSEGQFSNY